MEFEPAASEWYFRKWNWRSKFLQYPKKVQHWKKLKRGQRERQAEETKLIADAITLAETERAEGNTAVVFGVMVFKGVPDRAFLVHKLYAKMAEVGRAVKLLAKDAFMKVVTSTTRRANEGVSKVGRLEAFLQSRKSAAQRAAPRVFCTDPGTNRALPGWLSSRW